MYCTHLWMPSKHDLFSILKMWIACADLYICIFLCMYIPDHLWPSLWVASWHLSLRFAPVFHSMIRLMECAVVQFSPHGTTWNGITEFSNVLCLKTDRSAYLFRQNHKQIFICRKDLECLCLQWDAEAHVLMLHDSLSSQCHSFRK